MPVSYIAPMILEDMMIALPVTKTYPVTLTLMS